MAEPGPPVFSDRVRGLTASLMARLGQGLHRLGVHPDLITIAGLVVVMAGAALLANGQFLPAGLVLLAGLPLDALDGAVARAMERRGSFGAVLDSSLDRYADAAIFVGFSYYFATQGEYVWMLVAQAALVGSLMVSYLRARAADPAVGLLVKVGWFSRLERVAVLILTLLTGSLPIIQVGLLVLAVGTNFTALQRLLYVYRALNEKEE
jgi:CDP-diacylglycerol---glycerol-3-phosphate 3-phosphatidyltransferase